MKTRNLLIVAGAMLMLAPAAQASDTPQCNPGAELTHLAGGLSRVAQRIAALEPVTIVAMGSSSTAGVGATSADRNYPNQLEMRLNVFFEARKHFSIDCAAHAAVDDAECNARKT